MKNLPKYSEFLNESDKWTGEEMLAKLKIADFPKKWTLLKAVQTYEDSVIGYLKDTKKIKESVNEATDSAGHPSHIRIRNTKAERINRINALYDAYHNLAKHMEESGVDPEKVAKIQQKADDLFKHVQDS